MRKNLTAQLQSIFEEANEDPEVQKFRDLILKADSCSYTDLLLLAQEKKADTNLRATVCWILGKLGNKRASSVLITIAANKQEAVFLRQAAIQALGQLGVKKSAKPLLFISADNKETIETRRLAIHVLGWLGNKRVFKLLQQRLNDSTEDVKLKAEIAEALANGYYREAVPDLIRALHDSSAEVRFWAAYALGELGDTNAIPELEKLAASDDAVVPDWGAVNQEAQSAIDRLRPVLDKPNSK